MQTIIKNPSWWRRRSILEICLTLISISALIAVIQPAEASVDDMTRNDVLMSHNDSGVQNKSGICFSAQCIRSASEMLSKMKPEIQPCDDFYQFACGKFINEVVIPEDEALINAFSMTARKVTHQAKRIIMEERPPTDPKHLRLPNIFYKACMKTTLLEDLGATPIKKISDAVGGWPLIKGEAWDSDDKWSWQDTANKLLNLGFPNEALFRTSLPVDQTNNTNRLLMIYWPSFEIQRNLLVNGFNETTVHDYYDYMVDIAVLFGADEEKAKIELREVLEFAIRLANIPLPVESRVLSIKELQESYPYVQWLDFINGLLPEELAVHENEPINMAGPSFFEGLGPLLAETPKRVIANYMIWQIHEYAVPFLSKTFRKRYLQYKTVTTGVQKMKPRWKECVDLTKERLEISVGSLYVQRYFRERSKALAGRMVNSLRSAFRDILNDVVWMDDITKKVAKKKLHSMGAHIAYPEELLDDRKLEGYYRKLEIDPDQYFESNLKIISFNVQNIFNKLHLPVNKTDWEQHSMPLTVTAYYTPTENSLILPAGILQGPFFNAQRPKYNNYGAIGFVIGHEISHAFDNDGRQYDVDGNVVDWWQSNTQELFQDKITCIEGQYGNYTEKSTGLNLNGGNTLDENIADNAGVKAAYIAYRKWAAANGPEPKLPGLDYTPEQMFWISSAQLWCTKHRKEHLTTYITSNEHSPPEFRVLGSFRNMKDFSKDFQCPVGSPMNPVHKCEVW